MLANDSNIYEIVWVNYRWHEVNYNVVCLYYPSRQTELSFLCYQIFSSWTNVLDTYRQKQKPFNYIGPHLPQKTTSHLNHIFGKLQVYDTNMNNNMFILVSSNLILTGAKTQKVDTRKPVKWWLFRVFAWRPFAPPHESTRHSMRCVFGYCWSYLCLARRKVAIRKPDKITF